MLRECFRLRGEIWQPQQDDRLMAENTSLIMHFHCCQAAAEAAFI
jgi:hypothetical protein